MRVAMLCVGMHASALCAQGCAGCCNSWPVLVASAQSACKAFLRRSVGTRSSMRVARRAVLGAAIPGRCLRPRRRAPARHSNAGALERDHRCALRCSASECMHQRFVHWAELGCCNSWPVLVASTQSACKGIPTQERWNEIIDARCDALRRNACISTLRAGLCWVL